jgi:glycosyltransferase involved in cell wall biosynthesis
VITIITVTLNNVAGLNKTLKSISQQSYKNIELIVIDGVSIDGTKQLIESSEYKIDKLLIEPDEGTYDAMNKGLKLASGQWVLFMNSGDYFAETDSLRHAVDCINDNVDVVFSDWIYENSNSLISADISKLNVRHQSVLYRLKLHDTFGQYVVGKGVSISDYIFFLSIKHKNWKYCPTPISICDESGTSSMPQHFYQRLAAEIIFGKRTRVNGALIILLYPIYSFLKRSIFRTRH